MQPDKPVRAHNVPTPTGTDLSRGQVAPEQVEQATGRRPSDRKSPPDQSDASRLATEARLKGEAESRPVAGTPSRPYNDEPGVMLRSHSKSRDPADSAAQPRAATPPEAKPKLRSQ